MDYAAASSNRSASTGLILRIRDFDSFSAVDRSYAT